VQDTNNNMTKQGKEFKRCVCLAKTAISSLLPLFLRCLSLDKAGVIFTQTHAHLAHVYTKNLVAPLHFAGLPLTKTNAFGFSGENNLPFLTQKKPQTPFFFHAHERQRRNGKGVVVQYLVLWRKTSE